MLKNYLKIAIRNILRNKFYSSINIVGLSIGLAACLLILQYVSFELSYDQFNKNESDIYRVVNDRYQNGKLIQHGTITYSGIGPAMKSDFPEVVNYTRVEPELNRIISYNAQKIGGQNLLFVENSFLNMFTYPLIAGNSATALKAPYSAILSQTLAKKIFNVRNNNYTSLLGKGIIVNRNSTPYKITGICRDVPENSHLQFDLLLSYPTLYTGPNAWEEAKYDFTDSDFWQYIQLKHGTNSKELETKFNAFSQRHFNGNKVSGSDEKFYLQPLSRAHLYSDFEYEIGETASSTVVWGLFIIAMLIILIAWVNYVNLSTARSLKRAKEVGIRKVSGAAKKQLIVQFLSESFIINIIAMFIALDTVTLAQSSFNNLVHHQLSFSYLFQKGLSGYGIPATLLALFICGIFVSGFYPAVKLSSIKPALVLKGNFTSSEKGIALRKVLVVGQFAITVALIIGSIIVYQQMRFVNNQNLGFNMSQILVVRPPELTGWDSTFISRENSFTDQLKQLPYVYGASTSINVPGGETGRSFNIHRIDQNSTIHLTMRHNAIGIGFIELYKIKILAGRGFTYTDFNPNFDRLHNLIINEAAVKLLGYSSPQDAIGKTILRGQKKWDIVGVVDNYHQKSLQYSVEPTILLPAYSNYGFISVKVGTKDLPETISSIKKEFNKFFPGNLFDYFFLNEHFNKQYANVQLFGKVFSIFAGFAIFIACLGLLGLSLFATAQRTKEIGVRKVLGASVLNIVILLSKDFIKLVIIAFVIASPIAWYIMHNWLQDFAYRVGLAWWMFLLAGGIALVIALATVSFQAIKAALANPVKSLRYE